MELGRGIPILYSLQALKGAVVGLGAERVKRAEAELRRCECY